MKITFKQEENHVHIHKKFAHKNKEREKEYFICYNVMNYYIQNI